MTDTFNPHEILSRLRAKPVSSNNNVSANTNSTTNSSGGNGNQSSSSNVKTTNSKAIKTPQSLTLTPTQRQDNLAVRNELEKEIKRLQEEIVALKSENKQLKADKADAEKQYMDLKAKTDETVTKLRGKIAALTNHRGNADGTGKVYPPPPPALMTANKSLMQSTPKSPGPMNTSKGYSTIGKPTTNTNFSAMGNPESFREPTFSELMRRSTEEHPQFLDSLRKVPYPSNTPAPPPAPTIASQHLANNNVYPFESTTKTIASKNNASGIHHNIPNMASNNDPFAPMQDMKSPGGSHYPYQFSLGGSANSRNNPNIFNTESANSFPSDLYPSSSSGQNFNNLPNTPMFSPHHNVFNSSKHHPNLFYNNSNNSASNNDIMMIPGRDDNVVLIPNRKSSVAMDMNNNNALPNSSPDIPVVEIDLS